jgi:hypothetical protein
MQVLNTEGGKKERVILSYTEGDRVLHQLMDGNGAWQWGIGEDTKLVESVEEVTALMPHIPGYLLSQIETWLAKGGVNAAVKDKRMRIMEDMAQKAPGKLDSMLAELGDPQVTATILETITALLKNKGSIAEQAPANVQRLEHGALVQKEDGTREFVPSDDLDANSVLEREQALDAAGDEETMAGAIAGSVKQSTAQAMQEVSRPTKRKR